MGEQRRYWLGFNLVGGIGAVRLRGLLDAFGDVESAWNAPEAELRASGLDQRSLQRMLEARAQLDLDRELAKVEDSGCRLVTWEDEGYPERLLEIDAPPPVLYVKGELRLQDRWAAAVVGTCRPTAYGNAVARDLATVLAGSGVTVVSGLARGIDATAHQAVLEAGGRTLAVLGSGLDKTYPPEHRRLAGQIAEFGGAAERLPTGDGPRGRQLPAAQPAYFWAGVGGGHRRGGRGERCADHGGFRG